MSKAKNIYILIRYSRILNKAASLWVLVVTSITLDFRHWRLLLPALKIWSINLSGPVWLMGRISIINGNNLALGSRVSMGSSTRIACYESIFIDDDFLAAPGLNIDTGSHDPATLEPRCRPIHIGKRVWCGLNVTVLGGVTIGDDVVIGAGSVVTKSIPSNVIAAGVPCRVIRPLNRSSSSDLWSVWR